METSILITIIIALSFFGEAIFGFGGGLIAIPLISLLIGVKEAVTLVLIFQLLMGLLLWQSHKHIDWSSARLMTPGLIIGTLAGTLLLSQASVTFLQLFLAVLILVFLAKMLWFSGFSLGKKSRRVAAVVAGGGGGLLQGLMGTGGPVLTMYLTVAIKEKASLRATLIYLFFVTGLVRICISVPSNLFTESIIKTALVALPFFLISIFYGQKFQQDISDRYYHMGIYIVLGASAVLLLGKSL